MKIINRKAFQNYQILDRLEAGISLTGAEIKSIRTGRLNLAQSYVRIVADEVFLIGANIPPWTGELKFGYNPERARKLLLHRSQINLLMGKTIGSKLTIIPLSLYIKKNLAKVEIGLAAAKKKYEKREVLRKRDMAREVERELREKN